VQLLQEQLIVNRHKRKIGEVVVRKEVKTRLVQVQVPVRQEKLIVEQVSPELKQLAEIELGESESVISDWTEERTENIDIQYLIEGEFSSPRVASDVLAAIALEKAHGCKRIRVEIWLDDSQLQDSYQDMFDRYADADRVSDLP
jgi:uncharacterized protein (TIGR02271 family)